MPIEATKLDEPVSSLAAVLRFFNSDEGMPAGCPFVRVPTSEISELSAEDRLDLRRCLDAIR